MSETRETKTHARRLARRIYPLTTVAGLVFVACVLNLSEGVFLILASSFVLLCVFGLWWQNRLTTQFICPECGCEIVRDEPPAPGAEYTFHCVDCDIVWRTGMYFGD